MVVCCQVPANNSRLQNVVSAMSEVYSPLLVRYILLVICQTVTIRRSRGIICKVKERALPFAIYSSRA